MTNINNMTVLEAINVYGELCWRVLPVNGKKPSIKDWPNTATYYIGKIKHYFKETTNIGIAAGKATGIVVIDIDPRNGGDASIKELKNRLGELPDTVEAITGGNGTHLIFKYFEGAKSKVAADGIDFLADGKMFVAAPSIHPETKNRYEWKHSPFDRTPAELPKAWIDWLCGVVDVEVSETLIEGERNNGLLSLAGKKKSQGGGLRSLETYLFEENQLRCKPPLQPEEVSKIAASVYAYGKSGKSLKTQFQEAVFEAVMPSTRKLLLMALSMFADKDGRSCYPTQEQVAKMACCTSKTVRTHFTEAEKLGWFQTYRKGRVKGHGYNYGYILKNRPEIITDLNLLE